MVLSCDIRIASDRAKFSAPEVSLGITPGFGGTQRLPRAIGPARALELMLTGRMIDAQEAAAIGLVNRVVPHEELAAEVLAVARAIAANGSNAVRLTKRAVRAGQDIDVQAGCEIEASIWALSFDEERTERMTAFLEKRKNRSERPPRQRPAGPPTSRRWLHDPERQSSAYSASPAACGPARTTWRCSGRPPRCCLPGRLWRSGSIDDIPLYNADVQSQGDPEPVARLKKQIEDCDAFLIATPEYNYSIPGVLKNALDWASRPPKTCCLREEAHRHHGLLRRGQRHHAGTARPAADVRVHRLLRHGCSPSCGCRRAGECFDENGALVDDALRERLGLFLFALVDWASTVGGR